MIFIVWKVFFAFNITIIKKYITYIIFLTKELNILVLGIVCQKGNTKKYFKLFAHVNFIKLRKIFSTAINNDFVFVNWS